MKLFFVPKPRVLFVEKQMKYTRYYATHSIDLLLLKP